MGSARRFVVSGLVQGVGFRYYALRRAQERGVVGEVRNLPDGRVEVIAEGESDPLDAFGADLQVGPGPSKVQHVETLEIAPTGRFTAFTIAR